MKRIFNGSVNIEINNDELTLLPQKAVYYRKERALILADIHLGKAGHFRNAGMAVPAGLAFADLRLLDDILNSDELRIEKLIILGDMFHATLNSDWRIFEEWRKNKNELEILLIKGNHDILNAGYYESMNIKVSEIMVINNFLLLHDFRDEEEIAGLYKLCGHIHPAIRIHGKAKQAVTLSCFYFNETIGILPAFGSFTGRHVLHPSEKDFVFAVACSDDGDKVIRI